VSAAWWFQVTGALNRHAPKLLLGLALLACGPVAKPTRGVPERALSVATTRPAPTGVVRSNAPLVSWRTSAVTPCRGIALTATEDPASGDRRAALTLESLRIHAIVSGGLARTEVVQELTNNGVRPVEARLAFALPGASSVSRFAIQRRGRWLEAGVFDSDQIASIPRGPVTQAYADDLAAHDDTFVMRIVDFAGKQRRKVLLAYDEVIEHEHDREIYRYAMSGSPCGVATVPEFALEVSLMGPPESFSAITPNYPAEIRRMTDRVLVTLHRLAFVPNRDFTIELQRRSADDVETQVEPATAPDALGHVSLGFDLPELPNADPSTGARSVARVIVLDKSYHQSPAAFRFQAGLVEQLFRRATADEHFRLLACDSACSEWPSSGASVAERATQAAEWLSALSPSGTFDLEGALAHARALLEPELQKQIIFLGTGSVSSGTLDRSALVESCVRLLSSREIDLRIFSGGPRRDDALLFALATAVNATYDALADAAPIELTADGVLRQLRSAKLSNVRVELPTGLVDALPTRGPALVMGQAARVSARMTTAPAGAIRVSGTLGGRPYAKSYSVDASDSAQQSGLVARLWASERLREVERKITGSPFEPGASELSRRRRVATRHTDWLLLEADSDYAIYGLSHSSASGSRGARSRRPRGAFPERPWSGPVPQQIWTPASPNALPRLMPAVKLTSSAAIYHDGSESNPQHDLRRQEEILVLRSRFSDCYEHHAGPDDWFEGRVDFALRIDARGGVESLAAEAEPWHDFRSFFACLRAAAAETTYEPPRTGPLELLFAASFAIDWNRGLIADVPVPPTAFSNQGSILTPIAVADERWRTAVPRSSIAAVLDEPSPAQMLAAARALAEREPNSLAALDLLAAVAGAQAEGGLALATLEAELALSPAQRQLRERAARGWLAAGDEQRACAHLRALATGENDLAAVSARCKRRWLSEFPQTSTSTGLDSAPLTESELPALGNDGSCLPFRVAVTGDDPGSRPVPIVLTPDGGVVSAFGHIPGRGQSSPLSFWPAAFGTYRVVLLGGKQLARGALELAVHLDAKRLEFQRVGVAQTIASVDLSAHEAGPFATGIPLCGARD